MSTTDLGEQRRLQGIVALEALRPGGEAAAVTTPVRLADGTEVAVGCSVGVAVGDPEDTADAPMQRADGAGFTTKRARGAAP